MTGRSGVRAVAAALLVFVAVPGIRPAFAQQPATAFLPSTHWAVAAARRLAELGLADSEFAWGDGSLTRGAVARALHDAVAIAQRKNPRLEPLAEGWWLRFQRELPATAAAVHAEPDIRDSRGEGWAALGYHLATGRLYPVRSLDNTRTNVVGPFRRPDLSELGVDAAMAATLGSHLAVGIEPERRDDAWQLRSAFVLATWGKLGVWAGRRAPAFGPGAGGGIVIDGTDSFTGGGFVTTEPFRLPWVLRYLGRIHFENFISRLDSNAAIRKPWFTAVHASISPHPRLLLGATEAYMFGGDGVAPVTWRNVTAMFFTHGINSAGTEFEDGIASFEIRVRPPVPVVPLTLYLEWGTEDNHAAWILFPGRVIGAHVPAVPGLPSLSLGVEHTYFAAPCSTCDGCHCEYYATWYRHYLFKDGWTVDRQPIGNALGGQGFEWRVYGTWDDPARRLRLDAQTFYRDRGPFNIYSPAEEGRSAGGQLSATLRASPHVDLVLTAAGEQGHGWSSSSLFSGFRWLF